MTDVGQWKIVRIRNKEQLTYVRPRQQMMRVRMRASRKMRRASAMSSHQTHQ